MTSVLAVDVYTVQEVPPEPVDTVQIPHGLNHAQAVLHYTGYVCVDCLLHTTRKAGDSMEFSASSLCPSTSTTRILRFVARSGLISSLGPPNWASLPTNRLL